MFNVISYKKVSRSEGDARTLSELITHNMLACRVVLFVAPVLLQWEVLFTVVDNLLERVGRGCFYLPFLFTLIKLDFSGCQHANATNEKK